MQTINLYAVFKATYDFVTFIYLLVMYRYQKSMNGLANMNEKNGQMHVEIFKISNIKFHILFNKKLQNIVG